MMTVKELIAWLQKLPPDTPVKRASPSGCISIEDLGELPFVVYRGSLFTEVYDTYLDGAVTLEEFIRDSNAGGKSSMTKEEFETSWEVLLAVARMAQVIPVETVQKLLETVNYAHAVGPIFEPTMYRDGGLDNLENQKDVAEGFLAFLYAIDKVKARSGKLPKS